MQENSALIIVDLQNDFCGGGSLPVPGGDEIVPIINRLMGCFPLVVATQDWHPRNHVSFASNHPGHKVGDIIEVGGLKQILWPEHCVQGTFGADLHPELNRGKIHLTIYKGTDSEIDSYSGFFDNARRRSTGLERELKERGIRRVYITGLATDYCVKYTALDALELGFETWLIAEACRGVNVEPSDVAKALDQMRGAGVRLITSEKLVAEISTGTV